MKCLKQFNKEEFVPKFERALKTPTAYTGTINGKTWVVPHSFHGSGDVLHGAKVTSMRHNIVVSPIHVAHNNPSLTPQEHARVLQHIKDTHGGQEGKVPKFDSMGKLDEDLKADWNRDFSKNRRSNIKRTMKQNLMVRNAGKGAKAWLRADKEDREQTGRFMTTASHQHRPYFHEEYDYPDPSQEKAPEQKKDDGAATRKELKAARPMRTGAAERFMQRYGKTKIAEEERQQSLHLGMTMADRVQPSKEVPEVKKAETHYKKTHKPVKGTPEYQAERDKYRHPALAASRRAATLAFAKKHHLLEIKNMLNESKPKNGGRVNPFDYHQTQIAKKTLRMPDAMVGVMGGPDKDESRKHLKKMGWTDSQIHKHEHDQFVSEHVWNVTDHLGNKHEVEAKDRSEAMRKTVSVGSKIHPEGIPLTQWNKVKVERKNLEERTLTTGEDAKKEEIVKSMKKNLQSFKSRYGKDAKSIMYATATKQAKRLSEDTSTTTSNPHSLSRTEFADWCGKSGDEAHSGKVHKFFKDHKWMEGHHYCTGSHNYAKTTGYDVIHHPNFKKKSQVAPNRQAFRDDFKRVTDAAKKKLAEDVLLEGEAAFNKVLVKHGYSQHQDGESTRESNKRGAFPQGHVLIHRDEDSDTLSNKWEHRSKGKLTTGSGHAALDRHLATVHGPVKESVEQLEQLDELKKSTLKNYINKAYPSLHRLTYGANYQPKKDTKRLKGNRQAGIKRAWKTGSTAGIGLTESEQLDESFMGTYTRNENANRHTANIVHLAKHFGSEADKAQAKFYADELKKHGHNKHHEESYKLHEKLWPLAQAAHHMTEESEQLVEEILKSSHGTADGHSHAVKSSFSNGKFHGTIRTSHRDNRYTYTGPEARSPVEHEKPKHWEHDVRHGTTSSAIRRKNPHLDHTQSEAISRHFEQHKNKVAQLSEGIEQLDELKMPSRWTNIKHALGYDDRSVKASAHRINHETKNMSDTELHALHKSYGKTDKINPEKTAHGSNQHMQQRAIHREVTRRASSPQEPLQEHSDTFNTVRRVLRGE